MALRHLPAEQGHCQHFLWKCWHRGLLYYQPQVEDDRGTGAEVPIRWKHPTSGFMSPGAFIPLAEKTGLILPLGTWVLEAACHQISVWADHPLAVWRVFPYTASRLTFQMAPSRWFCCLSLLPACTTSPSVCLHPSYRSRLRPLLRMRVVYLWTGKGCRFHDGFMEREESA